MKKEAAIMLEILPHDEVNPAWGDSFARSCGIIFGSPLTVPKLSRRVHCVCSQKLTIFVAAFPL
ncbi:hypothetical protein KCP71_17355 [Salmonella enterica subsp. enterica]|nr:hypothetical protein KCP71_17355 [Salmonella enterica subsp. enterica]